MKMDEIAHVLKLKELTSFAPPDDVEEKEPASAYTSDMLSCVMAGAPHGGIWVTLQAHANIVAVAALLDLAGVIITEGAAPDETTIQKANEKYVRLFSTQMGSFEVVGKLWSLGIRAS